MVVNLTTVLSAPITEALWAACTGCKNWIIALIVRRITVVAIIIGRSGQPHLLLGLRSRGKLSGSKVLEAWRYDCVANYRFTQGMIGVIVVGHCVDVVGSRPLGGRIIHTGSLVRHRRSTTGTVARRHVI